MEKARSGSPIRDKVRSLVEERLAVAEKENGEKLTVEWRGEQIHRYVISVPVDLLFYNPDTHRIRAQRTVDPQRDKFLREDPWSVAGQDYLDYLLKSQPSAPDKIDPDFEKLKGDLDDFGQQQPGLITPDGVLVNGNTRCAALRDLGKQHIRVAVLPTDTTRQDISDVELTLQLRKESKRDYSYINRLIAMDEQLSRGRHSEDVAREFHIKLATLDRDIWIYDLIKEAIKRSKTQDGASLRLVDFEDHQEKLRELHRAYVATSASDHDAAENLKETRLALIVLGFSKTDIRNAGPEFYNDYLKDKLPSDLRSEDIEPAGSVNIPGLDIVVDGPSRDVLKTKYLTDRVLQARTTASDQNSALSAESIAAAQLLEEAKNSTDAALVIAGRDERLRQRKIAAADRLSDATESVEQASADVAKSLSSNTMDEIALDEVLVDLKQALLKLGRNVSRAVGDPGRGVKWLTSLNDDEDE